MRLALDVAPTRPQERCVRRQFHLLDVFTDRPLAGNPLAIVIDSEGLDAGRMQKIAAEFNLSETAFVLPPRDPTNTAALRIFTPRAELPFAGHPMIGAAILIGELRAASLMRSQDIRIVLEAPVGAVTCIARHRPGKAREAELTLPKLPARVAGAPPAGEIAAALGLAPKDIGFARHEPAIFSAGTGFTCIPVASRAALAAARPQRELFDKAFVRTETAAAYLYARGTDGADFDVRMFAPTLGIPEDPATGAAAAAFAGVLMCYEDVPDGHHAVTLAQGAALGRSSRIVLALDVENGRLAEAAIGGAGVIIADGTLDL